MKTSRAHVPILLLFSLICFLKLPAADDRPGPAGHWEGAITLPTAALGIQVDLSRNGEVWQGTIDIPAQGLRGFKLDR